MNSSTIKLIDAAPATEPDTDADPLVSVVPRRLYDGLCEAMRLTCEELPQKLPCFREVIRDVLDRAEAWALTRVRDAEGDEYEPEAQAPGQDAVTRIGFTMLRGPQSQPVTEWLLIPFGEIEVERPLSGESFTFTRRHAESAKLWFEALRRKLAIDYEHQTFDAHNSRPDGLSPAAGWIGGLEVRSDGLWAVDVSWTDRAVELLRSGEYKYFSPVIFWTDEDFSDVAALGPVALTNDPAMRGVQPLAASRVLPAEDGSQDHEAVPHKLLDDLQVEVSTLRKQIMARDADAFVEGGMRSGKILDSTSMDWRDDYLRDAKQTQQRLERVPVLRPPGRILKLDARGEPLSGSRVDRLYSRDSETYRRLGIEPEDLEAFERAAVEGRVQVSGACG